MIQLPSDLAAAVAADLPVAPPDLVAALRAACENLREREAEVESLDERLERAKTDVRRLKTETLVDLMDRVGVGAVELVARGNYPAARVEVKPHISANIAAPQSAKNKTGWPEERRRAAFDWLDEHGEGDLIKTTITCRVPREARAFAVEVAQKLRQLRAKCAVDGKETEVKMDVEVTESVSHMTLSAWLRERLKRNLETPLDVVGGYVERVAELKVIERK